MSTISQLILYIFLSADGNSEICILKILFFVSGELSYKKSVSLPRAFANADLQKLQVHVPPDGMYQIGLFMQHRHVIIIIYVPIYNRVFSSIFDLCS